MKTLQNNFTTPEQSKRLLELGVPVDSADCYYVTRNSYTAILHNELFTECRDKMIKVSKTAYRVEMHDDDVLPCWSVGRLIEIMLNSQIDTGTYALGFMVDIDTFNIEYLIEIIDEDIKEFDFSKLEE